MPHRSLEALRLLSNLETEKEKLLHIFFFAQPEFELRLAEAGLRQLRQRITFAYGLKTLRRRELAAYLNHRLQVAGFQGPGLFSPAAVGLLHRASKGVPRMINLLAHKALLAAYGKGLRKIDRREVSAAIRDTGAPTRLSSKVFPTYVLEFSVIMAVAVVTLVAWGALQ